MHKSFKSSSLIVILTVLMGSLYAQRNTASLGMSTGPLFNVQMSMDDLFDETIFSYYLSPSVKFHRNEFLIGVLVPIIAPHYTNEKIHPKVGATASYRFFVLNPDKPVNIIVQYEFQYISYTKEYDSFSGWSGTSHYLSTYKNFNSLIGVGFIGFFNQKHSLGFSATISYMFPVELYQHSSGGEYRIYKWGNSDQLNNYLNYCFSLYVKLISFSKYESDQEKK